LLKAFLRESISPIGVLLWVGSGGDSAGGDPRRDGEDEYRE
jgi:hypothetical protein